MNFNDVFGEDFVSLSDSEKHHGLHSGVRGVNNQYPKKEFAADFETTVYDGQTETEVWSAAYIELVEDSEPVVRGSIDEFMKDLFDMQVDVDVYFHNLKFDGSFILNYLFRKKFRHAVYDSLGDDKKVKPKKDSRFVNFLDDDEMPPRSFKYLISSDGLWYSITVKMYSPKTTHYVYITFKDSLKKMPFSLKQIGKAFGTQHQKLEMDYKGMRYAGCNISDEERKYIENDVYVLKEAMMFLKDKGLNKMTIGSDCLAEFKSSVDRTDYRNWFLNLDSEEYQLPNEDGDGNDISEVYGSKTVDEYVRKAYRGGWCYVVKEKAGRIYGSKEGVTIGTVADVNSLYPSMMSFESGNKYPVGKPHFWLGSEHEGEGGIPSFLTDKESSKDKYYFVRVRTRFKLKEGYLPTIQIKGSPYYKGTEMLETSDYIDKNGVAHSSILEPVVEVRDGTLKIIYQKRVDIIPTMTLTWNDWELIQEHYDLWDTEVLDGCWFYTVPFPLFDGYMDKWKKIKMESKGAMRTLAKLFLNNLYGKMATSPDSDFKVADIGDEGQLVFKNIRGSKKKPGYIPIGAAITSYARCFTIRAAQANYHGPNERGFIYADTDSIHCDLEPEEIKGIKVHPTNFLCWSLESRWNEAVFVRAKTYIEHCVEEDGVRLTKPEYDIKCAGMPPRCKEQLRFSLEGEKPSKEWYEKASEEMKRFVEEKRTLKDFKVGLCISGKLMPKQIKGGVVLTEVNFEMKENQWRQ